MTSPASIPEDALRELLARLTKYAEQHESWVANSEAVVAAFADELRRFDAHDGSHNVYALRLAVDHQSSAKSDRQHANDLREAIVRLSALSRPSVSVDEVTTEQRQWALTAASQAFCNRGIEISVPWDGDLDDLEQERFDAMVAAIDAYNDQLSLDRAALASRQNKIGEQG